jgi:GH15 family glucan-1,4-alpha-glucosidase
MSDAPDRRVDYALIGDRHSAALVGIDGSIDWLCLPRFDSDACLAALLGGPEHGHWLLAPEAGGRATSCGYRGDTLVLETRWDTDDGSVVVRDLMPPRGEAPRVVRIVEGVSGAVPMELVLRPRFGFGEIEPCSFWHGAPQRRSVGDDPARDRLTATGPAGFAETTHMRRLPGLAS